MGMRGQKGKGNGKTDNSKIKYLHVLLEGGGRGGG